MHFASLEYAILLSVVFTLYWALSKRPGARLLVLLTASYLFYGWWNAHYLLLIIGSSALDFFVGQRLHRCVDAGQRKRWLAASLVGNLGLLGVFKYSNFALDSLRRGLTWVGVDMRPLAVNLTLPVGISFFTFQSMSYTIDIFRGQLVPTASPLAFAVFVAFFPQLVAGPIVRARSFLPQLAGEPTLEEHAATRGLVLIAVGLLKKAVIADLLAVNLVDRVFETPEIYTSAELLVGIYGYAFQIYCDFSAYSDIAIGSALLVGLQLPRNFNKPYLASNLGEFWRRWHISLSTWLRDYVYVPLGGSRGSRWSTYRNLMITMVLGGLWHGAAWSYVLWGALHGLVLVLTRAWQRRFASRRPRPLARLLGIVVTFHVLGLGWILFRSPSTESAWTMIRGLAQLTGGTSNVTPLLWALLAGGFATQLIPQSIETPLVRAASRLPSPIQSLMLLAVVLVVSRAATTQAVPFIYFQF